MSIKKLDFAVLETIEDQQKLRELIENCAASMARAKGESEFISESIKTVGKELSISKATLKKMITTYYKQDFDDQVASQEEFEILYTKVIK